jgi:HD-like signal output (HDOD) protein
VRPGANTQDLSLLADGTAARQATALTGSLSLQQLEERICEMQALPAWPTILAQLMGCLERPPAEVDFAELTELISRDESLAAQCVRLANSPLFGRRRRVESVHDAVIGLGLWRMSEIVFSCALPDLFDPFAAGVDATTFWRHALGCALVSQHLAKVVRSCSAEKAYLAGLLHDLGILVNATLLPASYRAVFAAAADKSIPLAEAEREVLGFTHADTGRILGRVWNLSPDITAVLQFHHDVEAAPHAKDLVALVHLSDLFCREHGLGYGYYEARQIEFTCSPAWLILVQTCRQMGRPYLSRFFGQLEDYFDEVLKLVNGTFGPAQGDR